MLQEIATENEHQNNKAHSSDLAHAQIRDQLDRVLRSPQFQTSKRYPSVLRYLVDRALEGTHDALKERTIGVEVLGRPPDYDTNQDPTVRVVAGEIRKRLSAYYLEPGHTPELRIELPIGSYTPKFTVVESPTNVTARGRQNLFWTMGLTLSAAVVLLVGYALMPSRSPLDRFWEPIVHGSPTVLVCVGQQTPWGSAARLNDPLAQYSDAPATLPEDVGVANSVHKFFSSQPVFSLMIMTAETNVAAYLRPRTSNELIRSAGATSLADLRQGPAVLIGSYSNYWAIHTGEDLRFRFKRDTENGLNWIEDGENLSKRQWTVKVNAPYTDLTEDYAIVSRLRDASTGQTLVSAGGVTSIGTLAASEFLVNPAGWKVVAQQAPRDWEHRNLQVVIGVDVINGNAGTPRILATHFW